MPSLSTVTTSCSDALIVGASGTTTRIAALGVKDRSYEQME